MLEETSSKDSFFVLDCFVSYVENKKTNPGIQHDKGQDSFFYYSSINLKIKDINIDINAFKMLFVSQWLLF